MAKRKRKKKNILGWLNLIIPSLIGIALIVIIVLFATGVWELPIGSSQTFITNNDIIDRLENPNNPYGVSCSLTVSPSVITAGDQVTMMIYDGKSTNCEIYGRTEDGNWILIGEGTTSASGSLSAVENVDLVGTFLFRALCGNCVTNSASLTVNPAGDCTDTDGRDRYTPGWVVADGTSYYDKCLDVGAAVTEFTCVDGDVFSENLMCDYGEECFETRSGGYCRDIETGYDEGDVIGNFPGSGSMTGTGGISEYIDLIGVETGGDCYLGVRIHTDWNYANDKCSGIMGQQGLEWYFTDSSGIRWSAVDTDPRTHDEDLCPLSWDGQTLWKISAFPINGNLPECVLSYNYNVEVYVCEC